MATNRYGIEDYVSTVSNAFKEIRNVVTTIDEFILTVRNSKRDIPEYYGKKDELGQNVEKKLDEFEKGASAGIKEPLNSIYSKSQYYLKDAQERYDREVYAARMREEARRRAAEAARKAAEEAKKDEES